MIKDLYTFGASWFVGAISTRSEGVVVFPWVFDLGEFSHYITYVIVVCILD